jgi:SAM-dependent methyltransferase
MDERAGSADEYVLGHAAREQQRLIAQAVLYRPLTEQLLREAGLGPGMRVLDAGCGAGDVSFLAAELVGPEGAVVGIDRSVEVLATARGRAAALGLHQVSFLEGEVGTVEPEGAFDAVVGRAVLMYVADPVAVVRHLAGRLRPGGVVLFAEADVVVRAWPPAPLYHRYWRWIVAALERSGAKQDMGLRLFTTFVAAGLPAPRVRMDGLVGTGGDWLGHRWIAESVRSLVPALERFGLATAEEVGIETLEARLRAELAASGGTVCPLVWCGAWTRLPIA